MASHGGGKAVVLLSSVTQGTPPRFLTHYVMAKAALWGLVQSAAVEYAEKKILINAVSPSMVDTRFIQNLPEAIRQEQAEQAQAKRFLTAQEVVSVLWRLLSDEADGQTGANLCVRP